MNQTRTERGNRIRGLWNGRAAMWMPVLLLAAAVAGEPSDAGAAEKENKAPAGLDPTVLRYLPDDCRVIAQVDVDAMLQTELGRKLVSAACDDDDLSRLLSLLKLEKRQVERVMVGARAFGDEVDGQGVTILFCKLPVVQVAPTNAWTAEEVGEHTVWIRSDKKTTAFSVVEERIVLIGTPEAVRRVLQRNAPTTLPAALGAACQAFKDDAGATFSFLPVTLAPTNVFEIPTAGELLKRVDAINVETDFGVDLAVRVSAICRDEATAQQLNGVGIAVRALFQSQGIEKLDDARQIFQSLQCHVDGSVLTVSAEVPGRLVSVGSKLVPGTASVVQGSTNGPLASVPVGNAYISPYQPGATLSPVAGASPQATVTLPNVPSYTSQPAPAAVAYPAAPATPAAGGPPTGPPYAGSTPSYTSPPPAAAYNPQPAPPQAVAPAATPSHPAVPWTQVSPWNHYSQPPNMYSGNYPPSSPAAAQRVPNPAIQIAEVIRMSEAGVDEEVVARYIRKGWLAAGLTADDLILLTEKKVSRTVIMALQDLPTK